MQIHVPLTHPEVDEAAARRTLRDQIARLEDDLSALVLSAWPHALEVPTRTGRSGAAILTLADLERTRDALADQAAAARRQLDARGEREEQFRRVREEMLLDPSAHRFARVSNAEVGEPGCCGWHVRPRFGLLGMLAGWWRVVVSSGCPLAKALRRPRHERRKRVDIGLDPGWLRTAVTFSSPDGWPLWVPPS